jgi:hypothetical protein
MVESRLTPTQDVISATYTYTFDRFQMLMAARRQRERAGKPSRYLVVSLLYSAAMLGLGWWDGSLWRILQNLDLLPKVLPYFALGIAFVCTIVFIVDLLFDKVLYWFAFRRYAIANQVVHIELSNDDISWASPDATGRLKWTGIKGLTLLADRSAAVMWLGKIEGLVLPADGFASETIFNAAVARIQEKSGVS